VFLFPSDTETFGNVTLEAMASGLPTVCANAVGSRDLVNDGTTGLLCPPDDTDAFTDAVRRLVLNPAERTGMGRAARDRARDFSWPTILERMNTYYDEALGRTPRTPAPSRSLLAEAA
jgi:glycosyltransferase involved in cell wall biosynthesis